MQEWGGSACELYECSTHTAHSTKRPPQLLNVLNAELRGRQNRVMCGLPHQPGAAASVHTGGLGNDSMCVMAHGGLPSSHHPPRSLLTAPPRVRSARPTSRHHQASHVLHLHITCPSAHTL